MGEAPKTHSVADGWGKPEGKQARPGWWSLHAATTKGIHAHLASHRDPPWAGPEQQLGEMGSRQTESSNQGNG